MIRALLLAATIASAVAFTIGESPTEPTGYDLTRQMIDRTKRIQTMRYRVKKQERIEDNLKVQISSVKLTRQPFQVYTRQEHPKAGIEVLYVEGTNKGRALVNPNGFPWMNLNLDPLGKIMRKNQHHLILHSGYDHVVSILEHLQSKYGDQAREMITLKGQTVYDGHDCWIVQFDNPDFSFAPHTVEAGETISSIAKKEGINEYMIVQRNEEVDNYHDLKVGQVISLPTDYCQKMTLYIDKIRLLPLRFKIDDDLGLYEMYEFLDMRIDVPIDSHEFTPEFHDYGF